MKKAFNSIVSAILVVMLTASCGSAGGAGKSGDLLSQVKERGSLIIAMEGQWAPWTYHDETDKLVGFDVEVAEGIAEKLGVKAEFVEGEWDGLFAGLDAGRYDIIANGVEITDERKEKYDFTTPYGYIHTSLIVSADNNDITSFEDLKGKVTTNSLASTYETIARSYGVSDVLGVDTIDETMSLVLSGRADATLNANVSFYDYMNVHPDAALKEVAQTSDASQVSVPVRKGEDAFVEAVNKAIDELRSEGRLSEISIKYFGSDITNKECTKGSRDMGNKVILDRAPMGWNSWDCYGPSVSEDTVRKNAEVMASKLKDLGWEYVVVDIQWYQPSAGSHAYEPFADLTMDSYGRLLPAENRFPSSAGGTGFKALAEYVHSLGLKFGIHIMRGIPRQAVHRNTEIYGTNGKIHARDIAKTASICVWNTDMYGVDPGKQGAREYYMSIFKMYADWGVDFIKCDDICRELPHEEQELILISECIRDCGRDMVLSLSPGPALLEKAALYKETSQMWRITDDFWDDWKLLYAMFERCEKWSIHTGSGCYPDADMLPVGAIRQNADPSNHTAFTEDEQRTMMTLWCIFRAPLMMGGDMAKLDDFTEKLLTAKDILSMQDLARHEHQVWRKEQDGSEFVLWTALRKGGGQYAALFNIGETAQDVSFPVSELEPVGNYEQCLDLWSGVKGSLPERISASLAPHACAAWLIS